jgi:SAM-dependent methyltransferase
MRWDDFFEHKIKDIASNSRVVLDVGGGRKFQKGMSKYASLFKDHDYITLDNVKDYQPDILGDIKNIPLADNSVDAIICRAVLEHIDDPFKAVAEIFRVLRPNGRCLVSLPFLYPYHADKNYYGDFYRYTADGVKYMFRNFSQIEIVNIRGLMETVVNLLPYRPLRRVLAFLARIFDNLFISRNQTSGYNIYLIK